VSNGFFVVEEIGWELMRLCFEAEAKKDTGPLASTAVMTLAGLKA
jgi:hypothetical protein